MSSNKFNNIPTASRQQSTSSSSISSPLSSNSHPLTSSSSAPSFSSDAISSSSQFHSHSPLQPQSVSQLHSQSPSQLSTHMDSSYEWIERQSNEEGNIHQHNLHTLPPRHPPTAAPFTITSSPSDISPHFSTSQQQQQQQRQSPQLSEQNTQLYTLLRPPSLGSLSSPDSNSSEHVSPNHSDLYSPISPVLSEGLSSLTDLVSAVPSSSPPSPRSDYNLHENAQNSASVDSLNRNEDDNVSLSSSHNSMLSASSSSDHSDTSSSSSASHSSPSPSPSILQHLRSFIKLPPSSKLVSALSWFAIGVAVGALITRSHYLKQIPTNHIEFSLPSSSSTSSSSTWQIILNEYGQVPPTTTIKIMFNELFGLYRDLLPFNCSLLNRIMTSPSCG